MSKLKGLFICSLFIVFTTVCTNSSYVGKPNPWIDCGQDIKCAKDKAGFNFPVELSNCNIRAMEDMIEIQYPFNNKNITIRKSKKYDGRRDISGDYNNYPANKEVSIKDTKFNIRGINDNDEIYVVNFSSKKSHYAIMSDKGLNLDEIWSIYEIIQKAEKL